LFGEDRDEQRFARVAQFDQDASEGPPLLSGHTTSFLQLSGIDESSIEEDPVEIRRRACG
jgi:hypothetical protein